MSGQSALALALDITHHPRAPEPEHRRTYDRVRRHSKPTGRERAVPMTWRELNAGRRALSKLRRQLIAKAPVGTRCGAPGTMSRITAEVWEYLATIAVTLKGNVFPRYDKIAKDVRCTVSSAVKAVRWLVDHGWLEYDRRFVETGNAGKRGPQVEQTSNWYRVKLGTLARRLLERWKAPDTDDGEEGARAAREAQRQAVRAQRIEDEAQRRRNEFAEAIARADAAIERRQARERPT